MTDFSFLLALSVLNACYRNKKPAPEEVLAYLAATVKPANANAREAQLAE